MLSEAARAEILALAERYPEGRQKSAVMPALYVVQGEVGWLPPEALTEVAELLELPPVHVAAVASFYTMYEKQPVGEHVVDVCCSPSCMLCGSYEILEHMTKKLGIKPGETTPDGKITLREQECIGACAQAPALQVDYRFHEHLTPEMVDEIIAALQNGNGSDG
jgi:NADH-quinone oxidoreductase subunit E